jgi:hypothetical protein
VDLNQGDSSVLLGHPQLVDTVSSVIQSRLICCIKKIVPLAALVMSSQGPKAIYEA